MARGDCIAIWAAMNNPAPVRTAPRERKPDWIRVKAPTSAGFNETREISEGFISGVNTLDFIANHTSNHLYPGIRCQFEPTTALIVARDNGGGFSGFSDLTDAQVDLIGQGTPVKALDGNDPYIWAYTGVGNKRSSGSYTQLRPA